MIFDNILSITVASYKTV